MGSQKKSHRRRKSDVDPLDVIPKFDRSDVTFYAATLNDVLDVGYSDPNSQAQGTNGNRNRVSQLSSGLIVKRRAIKKYLKKVGVDGDGIANKQKAFRHAALMDEQESKPVSSIDFEEIEDAPVSDGVKMQGFFTNEAYQRISGVVQKHYPYARTRPTTSVPIKGVFNKVDSVKARGNHTLRSAVTERVLGSRREMKLEKKQNNLNAKKALNSSVQKNKKYLMLQKNRMVVDGSRIISLAQKLIDPKSSAEDVRNIASSLYFIEDRTTLKAISVLATSEVNTMNPKYIGRRYNLPSKALADQVAQGLGLPDSETLVEEVLKSSYYSSINKLRSSAKAGKAGFSQDLEKYLERVQTPQAAGFIEKLKTDREGWIKEAAEFIETVGDDDDIEYEDMGDKIEDEIEIEDMRAILERDDCLVRVFPFRYSLIFSYRILYYFYMNEYGYLLPFGKTLPSLGWLLCFSYIVDSENVLGLRIHHDTYILKVGGLGLLEKSAFYDNTLDSRLKSLFSPTIAGSSMATGTLKLVVRATLTSVIRGSYLQDKIDSLFDAHSNMTYDLSDQINAYETSLKNEGLAADSTNKTMLNNFKRMLSLVHNRLTDDVNTQLTSMIFSQDLISVNRDQVSVADIFSLSMYRTAEAIADQSKRWSDGDIESKGWFVNSVIEYYRGRGGRFGIIYNMAKKPGFIKVLKILFRKNEILDDVLSNFTRASTIVEEYGDEMAELANTRAFASLDADNDIVRVTAQSIIDSDPTISALLNAALLEDKKRIPKKDGDDVDDVLQKRDMHPPYNEDANYDDGELEEFDSGYLPNKKLISAAKSSITPENNISLTPPQTPAPFLPLDKNKDKSPALYKLRALAVVKPVELLQSLSKFATDSIYNLYNKYCVSLSQKDKQRYARYVYDALLSIASANLKPGNASQNKIKKLPTTLQSSSDLDDLKSVLSSTTLDTVKRVTAETLIKAISASL